ncbi:TRAP transporter large permease [Dysosmobacter sp.]|uniref:TRAP transporter large permease n=1 Tax=Dysosmobacter sp. TaxID=2591382 RepID=UPI002A873149|nr:TRAP transporter large permease [Dysosmobacter sp.]MDY3281382.1 TRAP transporter large permease [Dysosmobacter sp.]
MPTLILIGGFFLLLVLNVPIGLCLMLSAVATLLHEGMSLSMNATNYYAACNKYLLLAIPFFIIAGNIMEKAQISTRLIDFFKSLVGHKKGGLAMVCVIVSCFFAAISGSGPATVAALGAIVIPAMITSGYRKDQASALMATGGAIGSIIPPSITFVLYGSITGTSIGSLFMSGMVPGVLVGISLFYAMKFSARKQELTQLPKASGKEIWDSFKDAIWALMMPVIILGGIYTGVFTPTEAAAVSAVYGLFVGVVIYRTVNMKVLYHICIDSIRSTGQIMFICACAAVFSWALNVLGLAVAASNGLIAMAGGNKYIFLMVVNVILLIAGCLLDGSSVFLIFTSILFPAAMKLGIDPIHFGTVMVINVAIGQVTPPVGLNLYVACGIGKVSLKEISYAVIPFVLASFAVCLLVTYCPILATFLPNLLAT